MKKQFFYAAMAVALMASCTSEDDFSANPVDPTPDAEEQVAINLGVATPVMTVGSRGTGVVGDVVENLDETPTKTWDAQELYMTMIDRSTGKQYAVDNQLYFKGLTFRAPRATDDKQIIRIYESYMDDGSNHNPDEGTLKYKYYPINGTYDFYGWHLDNALGTRDTTGCFVQGTAMVKDIQINGTQDIMAAKTIAIPGDEDITSIPSGNEQPYTEAVTALGSSENALKTYKDMVAKQFSARTARNGFTPLMEFKHALARLEFYVRSGKGSDAALNYMKENVDSEGNPNGTYTATPRNKYDNLDAEWTGDGEYADYADYANGAIYVTEVKVKDMIQSLDLNLITQTASPNAENNTEKVAFTLKSTPEQYNKANNLTSADDGYLTTKELQNLVYVAPEYEWGYKKEASSSSANDGVDNSQGKMATKIGESIMFYPNATDNTNKKIKISVKVGQCLINTKNESTDASTYIWDEPDATTLWVDAEKLMIGDQEATVKEFQPGKSYRVYITIYGRERIEVSASLVPWVEGGDVNTDIEDDVVNETTGGGENA